VAARDHLPNLTAIFLGDIIIEENEISWINQSDVSPLFTAYPALEHFRVRGGNGLIVGSIRHERLKSLIIESGGLPAQVVRDVAAATLPALEHLELWLGTEEYGGDAPIDVHSSSRVFALLFRLPCCWSGGSFLRFWRFVSFRRSLMKTSISCVYRQVLPALWHRPRPKGHGATSQVNRTHTTFRQWSAHVVRKTLSFRRDVHRHAVRLRIVIDSYNAEHAGICSYQ
jgi:hypothetical protein